MQLGILALQGDFAEHRVMLKRMGVIAIEVRLPEQLGSLSGLIIPGGESTTIAKLAVSYGFMEPLRQFAQKHAIWGTCAGAIFMSKDAHREQPLLEVMDITVERNAFGRQVDSFETDLDVPAFKEAGLDPKPYHAIFIRAPIIEHVNSNAQVLAQLGDGRIVAAQQGHLLATSFHPELTRDDRFHQLFKKMASGSSDGQG